MTAENSSTKSISSKLVDSLPAVSSTSSDEGSSKLSSAVSAIRSEVKKTQEDLAKSEQAAKEAANEIARLGKIQEIAGKYLEGRLDSMLDDALSNIWNNLGIDDEEVRRLARAYIRGYITTESELNADIITAKAEISKALTECVNEQLKNLSGMAAKEINKGVQTFNGYVEQFDEYMKKANNYMEKFDKEEKRISKQIDKALEKTSEWTDDKSMHAIDKFIEGLDKAVERGEKSIMGRIDNQINNTPIMKQLGISFKSNVLLGKTFESIEKKISAPLESKLKPYLQENVEKITSAVTYVNQRIMDIKNAENAIKDEIKKQEEIAKQFAETKLKEFAADIASKVNISLEGLTGGFGGFSL